MQDDAAGLVAAVASAPTEAVLEFNTEGRIVGLNAVAERMFGVDATELVGSRVDRLLMPDGSAPLVPEPDQAKDRAALVATLEGMARRPDGSSFPVDMMVVEIPGPDQRSFMAILRDASRRRHMEDDLDRFRVVIDQTVDMIATFDPETLQFLEVNQGAATATGYSREELLQMAPYDLKPLLPEAKYRRHIAPLLEGRLKALSFETLHRRKDGSLYPVDVVLQLVGSGGGDRAVLVNIVRDISSRKRAEEQRGDAEARVKAIVETVVDGIITINEQGLIETVNPAAERIFGYARTEMIGRNVSMLMPEPYQGEHDGYLRDYMRTGRARIIGSGREVKGRRKDGSVFPMDLAISEMKLGSVRMFAGIIRDITERKRLERMKNEFISTVSHELRTPLTSIRGSLGLIVAGAAGEMPDKAGRLLDIAFKNTERLIALVNDILDIEKIESGRVEFRKEPLPVRALIQQAIETNSGYAQQFDVAFITPHGIPDIRVIGDQGRLLQVMGNLLSNAAKYSRRGGKVEITVTPRAAERMVRIAVTDHGAGVPENFRARLFEKFAQADSSDTRQKGGSGLGLHISKAIIENLGGRIGFESAVGVGSTFHIDLRAADAPARTAAPGGGGQSATRQKLLVCEDDPDVALLLRWMLERAGFGVDVALDAKEAKGLIDSNKYDAMTVDLMLPDQDGLALVEDLRQRPDARDLPVVVVSAKADQGRKEADNRPNVSNILDWIQKPIDDRRLTEVLRHAVHSPPDQRRRILHVEDDLDLIHVVEAQVADIASVDAATTLGQARLLLATEPYDLVILDMSMPDGRGQDLLDDIKRLVPPPIPVLVFSAAEAPLRPGDLVAGALVKSRTSDRELVSTIRSLILDTSDAAAPFPIPPPGWRGRMGTGSRRL